MASTEVLHVNAGLPHPGKAVYAFAREDLTTTDGRDEHHSAVAFRDRATSELTEVMADTGRGI